MFIGTILAKCLMKIAAFEAGTVLMLISFCVSFWPDRLCPWYRTTKGSSSIPVRQLEITSYSSDSDKSFPSQFIKPTKVLRATPQGRRRGGGAVKGGGTTPKQVSNPAPPDSRPCVLNRGDIKRTLPWTRADSN